MASREIKDELRPEEETENNTSSQSVSPLQIQITPEQEKKLVQIILDDYNAAKEARLKLDFGQTAKGEKIDFEKWLKSIRDLYNGLREPKTVPWKFCSNRSMRIATSILDLLHARLFPSVVNEELLRWRPGESKDFPKVERISKLMHWWIWVRSRLRRFFDVWVKMNLGYGDTLTESFWKVKMIDSGKTIEAPLKDKTGQPIIGTNGLPQTKKTRKIDLFEMSASKVYMKENVFLQEHSMDITQEPVILKDNFLVRELEEGEVRGVFKNIQELKDQLPFEKPEGVIPEDEAIFKEIRLRNQPVEVLKWYGNFDADQDGFAEDVRITISPEHEIYIGGMSVRDLTYSGKRPIHFTKLEDRLDKPDENQGMGILEKVKELAEEIDAIFNQMTDGNTLQVLMPGFYDPGGDLDAPSLRLAPNKWTPVSDPQRNVYVPNINVPTEKLINAIRLVLEFVERLTAASSYVLGKESEIVGGSGTATRTNAIVQSAEQRFALPSERLREGASIICSQHLDILQLNIPPGLETRILGEDGQPLFDANELTQEGIAGEFDAYLLSDPSQGSKETERQLASMFYSILLQNIIVGTDPVKIYKITADLLKAYDKDPEEYLGPEPDFDSIDSPEDENTLILQGDFARVNAQITENHILHIQKHTEFLNSPSLNQLKETLPHLYQQVAEFTIIHITQHQRLMEVMIGLIQSFGGGSKSQGKQANGKNGNAESNGNAGNAPGVTPGEGMETSGGPLGEALGASRVGQSGSNPFG